MQRVLCIERSLEQCAESGWYAYVFNLTEPLDAELAERLEPPVSHGARRALDNPRHIRRQLYSRRRTGARRTGSKNA